MSKTRTAVLGLVAATLMAGAVPAASHEGSSNPAVMARHAQMGLYAFNLGTLGAMAQGKIPYDAAAAVAAAENIAKLSSLNAAAMWPAGTDSESISGTRALPALWQNFPDVGAKVGAVSAAADAMVVAAGTDLDALRAAMGPLGGACGACHKSYRQPE